MEKVTINPREKDDIKTNCLDIYKTESVSELKKQILKLNLINSEVLLRKGA